MKICITSQGNELSSAVDPRFGRAAWFIVVDTDSGAFEAVDNSEISGAAHGAGPQAASKVVNLGVDALITGHCGPNAFRALQAGGVKILSGASGTVAAEGDSYLACRPRR